MIIPTIENDNSSNTEYTLIYNQKASFIFCSTRFQNYLIAPIIIIISLEETQYFNSMSN
jgi:hypothetical protein